MVSLDIFADPVCPWSMIGKAWLDRALEVRPDHPFALSWHPFQLNPAMPPRGMARSSYLRMRFGAGAKEAEIPEIEAIRNAGIEVNLEKIRWMPNTFDAHRLLHWAEIEHLQTPVMSALFRAFWREGRDIGDRKVLAGIAAETGMEGDMVAKLLASDADRDTVTAEEAHARERGIRALPTFILGNQYVIEGAQAPEFWTRVIDEIAARGQDGAAEAEGLAIEGQDSGSSDPGSNPGGPTIH